MTEQARRRVPHVRDVAVAGRHALIGGFPAWLLHRLLADLPGGLEAKLDQTWMPADQRESVLRAVAALGAVGAEWRLDASTSGSDFGVPVVADIASGSGVLSTTEAASILGLTGRQVRSLANELRGRRDSGGRWWFEPAAVHAERERRRLAKAH